MTTKHEEDKVVSFERAGLVFVFNFHPTRSYTDYRIGVATGGRYRVVLDTDDRHFGGHGRIDHDTDHFTSDLGVAGRQHSLMVTF